MSPAVLELRDEMAVGAVWGEPLSTGSLHGLADYRRPGHPDAMASGKTPKAANLEALGAPRLAVLEAMRDDSYGAWDALVMILAPRLGGPGLDRLRQLTEAWQAEPLVVPPESERR
ncbi:MAG: DUF6880 family protein [Sphingomonas sp.]